MSLREELAEELTAQVDDVWAETIKLLPISGGSPDADRAVQEFVAVLRTGSRDTTDISFGRSRSANSRVAAEAASLRIDRVVNADLVVRQSDKIVAVDRVGQPVFELQHVDDRSHLRLICQLSEAV